MFRPNRRSVGKIQSALLVRISTKNQSHFHAKEAEGAGSFTPLASFRDYFAEETTFGPMIAEIALTKS